MKYIEAILNSFQKNFTKPTFEWLAITVLALKIRQDCLGVTSTMRTFALEEKHYNSLENFHKRAKFDLDDVNATWHEIALNKAPVIKIAGLPIIIGDHTKKAKEARFMPGVKRHHQESDNSNVAEYIHGHAWGCAGLLIGNEHKQFSLPLNLRIHDGLESLSNWEQDGNKRYAESMCVQMMSQIGDVLEKTEVGAIAALDGAFLTRPVLRKVNETNKKYPDKPLSIVTKPRVDCTAYTEAPPRFVGQRGAPRKKGKTIKLYTLFETRVDEFQEKELVLYGEKQRVRYFKIDLLWGEGLYQKLRFVLTVFEDGRRQILVTNNLEIDEESIIKVYGYRFKIECCFREMKQSIGAFEYHFWSKSMPKLNRFSKSDDPDPLDNVLCEQARQNIVNTVRAIHTFALCSCIATGILQMISLKFDEIDPQKVRYLRTYSSQHASESTTKEYVRSLIYSCLENPQAEGIIRIIQSKQAPSSESFVDFLDEIA